VTARGRVPNGGNLNPVVRCAFRKFFTDFAGSVQYNAVFREYGIVQNVHKTLTGFIAVKFAHIGFNFCQIRNVLRQKVVGAVEKYPFRQFVGKGIADNLNLPRPAPNRCVLHKLKLSSDT
jgi:hypothetical protein